VPANKITVAYPGTDASLSPVLDHDAIEAAKARYGITGDYLLYLGTLQPRKNLPRLVDAFVEFATRHSELAIQLVLAGKRGWLYDDLLKRTSRQGLAKRVRLPGYVAEEDKAALLSGALAFLFPSLYEGFGLPVLEAQACGCPVITSTTTSLPEVAGDGALLVDPEDTADIVDAMQRVATETGLREELIRRGFANTDRFSWEGCAETVLMAIEEHLC
jgi:glycosyltransferase involved in cell wall biosynthesis